MILLKDLLSLPESGEIPMVRIDDFIERILRVKFITGVHDHPLTDRSLIDVKLDWRAILCNDDRFSLRKVCYRATEMWAKLVSSSPILATLFPPQKEELHKKTIMLEKQLDAKQAVELEIAKLRGY